MRCMTLKVILILGPHLTHDPISPLIGSERLSWHHRTCCQLPSGLGLTHLEVNRCTIKRANLLEVVLPDEIVKRCKRRRNEGLNTHFILRWNQKDPKAPLEDPKDPLNDITCSRVMQIEQLLGVAWTWKDVNEKIWYKINHSHFLGTIPFRQMVPHVAIWDKQGI
jgi:hypothetical protein